VHWMRRIRPTARMFNLACQVTAPSCGTAKAFMLPSCFACELPDWRLTRLNQTPLGLDRKWARYGKRALGRDELGRQACADSGRSRDDLGSTLVLVIPRSGGCGFRCLTVDQGFVRHVQRLQLSAAGLLP
jgi:hypothetical protein